MRRANKGPFIRGSDLRLDRKRSVTPLAIEETINSLIQFAKPGIHLPMAAANQFSAEASAAALVSAKVLTIAMSAAIAAR